MSEIPSIPTPGAMPDPLPVPEAAPTEPTSSGAASEPSPADPAATASLEPGAAGAEPARQGRRRRSRGGRKSASADAASDTPSALENDGTGAAPQPRGTRTPQQQAKQQPKQQPGRPQRAPHPVLERLFALYPKLFGARFFPLKLGVFQELMARHPEVFEKEELKTALGLHTRSTRYLETVAAGEMRHDLEGQPVEPVAPEHVHHAIFEVFRRRQQRNPEDLRPKLVARLVQAIESSGLSREAYELAVRTPDEAAQAVLDEAFSVLAERGAKREALRRAFEASGQTQEAFAEMYGMELKEVRRLLA